MTSLTGVPPGGRGPGGRKLPVRICRAAGSPPNSFRYSRFRGPAVPMVPIAGGGDRSETTAIDRNIERVLWTSDSKSLLVGANDGTTVGLWLKPLDGAAYETHEHEEYEAQR